MKDYYQLVKASGDNLTAFAGSITQGKGRQLYDAHQKLLREWRDSIPEHHYLVFDGEWSEHIGDPSDSDEDTAR